MFDICFVCILQEKCQAKFQSLHKENEHKSLFMKSEWLRTEHREQDENKEAREKKMENNYKESLSLFAHVYIHRDRKYTGQS